VVEEVYEAFLREVLARIGRVRAGSTPGVEVGPMATPAQQQWVEQQLSEALELGATVMAGGERTDPASNVLQPTLLTDVDPQASVLREETFGPILPIVRVKDGEEALQRANETPYGLSASVWTEDRRRGVAVAQRIRAGAVSVNDALVHFGVPGLAFGGVGESGFGRTHGLEGLEEVTRSRGVVVDLLGLEREPWWFPYTRGTERLLKGMLLFRLKGGLRGVLAAAFQFMRGRRP
jgi:acyl-CoA reductase-like NAD-dependent aldehyde dehydrogenase